MNPEQQYQAFYRLMTRISLTTQDIALWHGLMEINRQDRWSWWFSPARQQLLEYTRLESPQLVTAQRRLWRNQLVRLAQRPGGPLLWHMVRLYPPETGPPREDVRPVAVRAGSTSVAEPAPKGYRF